jgi:MurNAc alpha-1-phosphate uridylyltransferase
MKAFILAAGLGTRLKPYTDTMPKPMVPVCGVPLIGHIFDRLKSSGITDVVVNLHHKADILQEYFKTRTDMNIEISLEDELLETGGGAKKALPLLGNDPFLMINGDAFWQDDQSNNLLSEVIQNFDNTTMDILLALYPMDKMILTEGVGDYTVNEAGIAKRSLDKTGDLMFAGVRLCHPRVFEGSPAGKFSFLKLMDEAESKQCLYGHIYKGHWHHISTPEDLNNIERELQNTHAA